jgi:hypothetical protein
MSDIVFLRRVDNGIGRQALDIGPKNRSRKVGTIGGNCEKVLSTTSPDLKVDFPMLRVGEALDGKHFIANDVFVNLVHVSLDHFIS